MGVVIISMLRRVGVAMVLALCLQTAPVSKPAAISTPPAMCHYMEVRLRKLHLVRPDLIPYPIAYEVYC
jgi:hypothetical protein